MKDKHIKILLIEDSHEESRLIREEMKDAYGDMFEVKCEERLSTGLECMEKEKFDIVLLDLSLPDSHGLDTFTKVHESANGTPIVVLSGNDDESMAIKTVQLGAQDYMIKGRLTIDMTVRSIFYAIERQKALDKIRTMVFTDELPGLYNRSGLYVLAEQQFNVVARTKSGLFVIFVDLDGLKIINDTLGHREGDQALIEATKILKETFRDSDIVSRLGGDEFAVVSIDVNRGSGKIIDARLKENIKAHNEKNKDKPYEISMSIGIAYYDPENPVSFDKLLTRADQLMYENKRARRKS